jgi:hypothetical protein
MSFQSRYCLRPSSYDFGGSIFPPVMRSHVTNTLFASACVCAAAPDGWFGISLNVEVESVGDIVQSATIREVQPDSPAFEQLAAGDQVTEIEGRRVTGVTLQTLESLMRKPIGEPLRVRLRRPTGDTYVVVLTAVHGLDE